MSVESRRIAQKWRRANRANKIGAIDEPRLAISHELVGNIFARATREEIQERIKRMHALKIMWRGDIPRYVLREFDS